MTAAETDRALVERVAKGDRAAVRLLFMRHHARVYRFAARQTGSELMADDIADGADTPEIVTMKEDKAAALRRFIDAIPEEHRTVIDLAYYHGQSVSEIGEVLGIPVARSRPGCSSPARNSAKPSRPPVTTGGGHERR